MNTFRLLILILSFPAICPAQTKNTFVIQDLDSFVSYAAAHDPRSNEGDFQIEKAVLKKTSLFNSAFLPKFEVTTALGPAPAYTIVKNDHGESVEKYDFSDIGPFVGIELKVVQPLNIRRLKNGLHAASCNIDLTRYDVRKNEVEMNESLQEIYFKYLFALQMTSLAYDVKKNLEKAIHQIDSLLEEEAPNVSQNDLFELKTYLFKVEDGLYQAQSGVEAAKSSMAFSLGADSVCVADSLLYLRQEKIVCMDSLKVMLERHHPDLKRLAAGLEAQQALVKVTKDEMAPAPFIAGSITYKKSWNERERTVNSTERLLDPFNKTEGSLGIGLRYNVNVWSLKDKYLKEKLELESLRQKQTYALKGLQLELKNQYRTVQMNCLRQQSAATSQRSADSWLKAMAIKYDLDPSQVAGLLKAYEKSIQATRDYYTCILDYNIAVAELIAKAGLTLSEYRQQIR